jgi:uncharacterized membrane protein
MNSRHTFYLASITSLVALILLGVAWEAFLAPLRPGGSWMVLKVLPLMIPLFGILRGKIYTYQYSSMLVWLYFTEGVVRALSDHGLSQQLAGLEVALSLVFFLSCIFFVRLSRLPQSAAVD